MPSGAPTLAGARVRVQPFTAGDIDAAYVGWLNDPAVVRYSNQRFRTHTLESCADYLKSFEGTANLFLSIRSLELARAVGTMTVYRSLPHGTADIGIMVGDPEAKGRGYGQEAWDLVLGWLVEQPDVRKVTCGTLAVNRAMIRIAQRAGMQPDGVRVAQEIVDGTPVDIVHYARFNAR